MPTDKEALSYGICWLTRKHAKAVEAAVWLRAAKVRCAGCGTEHHFQEFDAIADMLDGGPENQEAAPSAD